jgi:hypothetical protein
VANVYYGSYLAGATGNWNTVSNWYSAPGAPPGSCCCGVPGTPLGRVPNAATDSVILFNSTTSGATPGQITTGPSGGYAGSITWSTVTGLGKWLIAAGNYSGNITINNAGGSVPATEFGISGGSFSGDVVLQGINGSVSASSLLAEISGGTFTGTVTRSQFPYQNKITGGTYSPTATATQTDGIIDTVPEDPGFAAGGGTFSPQITITNLPDILGAGLPS